MAAMAEGWWSSGRRRKIKFSKATEQSRFGLSGRDPRTRVARIRKRNKREGERRCTRAKRVLQICQPWPREKERANNGARKGESDPRRGWQSITESERR